MDPGALDSLHASTNRAKIVKKNQSRVKSVPISTINNRFEFYSKKVTHDLHKIVYVKNIRFTEFVSTKFVYSNLFQIQLNSPNKKLFYPCNYDSYKRSDSYAKPKNRTSRTRVIIGKFHTEAISTGAVNIAGIPKAAPCLSHRNRSNKSGGPPSSATSATGYT